MITSTVLTLVVIPAVSFIWRRRGLEGTEGDTLPAHLPNFERS